MYNPEKFDYTVILLTEDSKQYDITSYATSLSWEEPEKQLAARLNLTVKNELPEKIKSKGRLSLLARPGCYVYLLYSYNGGKNKEVFRGRIIEWNPSAKASSESLKLKCYDMLYDLQESQDHLYFSSGQKTKSIINQVCSKWKIPLGKYSGANEKHGKLVFKSKSISSILTEVLDEAKKKGGKKSLLRAVKGKVQVLAYGENDPVYYFSRADNIISVNHKMSTSGMVTRVKVIGEEDDDGRRPVEATVDGQTKFGIRQKIYTRGKDESLDEAKKAAKDILKDDGEVKDTITIKTPDIPLVRKGDAIYLKTTIAPNGLYLVVGVTHDIDGKTMTMDLEKKKGN